MIGVEGLAVRPRPADGAEIGRRQYAHQGDVLLEARIRGEMAFVFLVQQQADGADILRRDAAGIHGDAIAAPAVRGRDLGGARLIRQQREVRRQEFGEDIGDIGQPAVIDPLAQALAEIEPWPEAVCLDDIEILRAADLHLVEGFRIAVEEGGREACPALGLELRDRLLDHIGLPHKQPQGRRGRIGIADERRRGAEADEPGGGGGTRQQMPTR